MIKFAFEIENLDRIKRIEYNYLNDLYGVGNTAKEVFEVSMSFEGYSMQMHMLRHLASELNTWRYGFSRLKAQLSDVETGNLLEMRDELLGLFDRRFGDVHACRNIFQHYKEYLFGNQFPARIKQQALDKVGLPIVVESGKIEQIQACIVGDVFTASDRSGRLSTMNIPTDFSQLVANQFDDLIRLLNEHTHLVVRGVVTTNKGEETALNNKMVDKINPHPSDQKLGTRFFNCRFSKADTI